jgi:hypothetical protein
MSLKAKLERFRKLELAALEVAKAANEVRDPGNFDFTENRDTLSTENRHTLEKDLSDKIEILDSYVNLCWSAEDFPRSNLLSDYYLFDLVGSPESFQEPENQELVEENYRSMFR